MVVSELFALTNCFNNHHKVHTLTYFGVHSATSAWTDPLTCSLQTADAVTLPCHVIWILHPLLTWCWTRTSCLTHIHQTPVRLCLSAIIWLFTEIDGHLSSRQPASLSCCSLRLTFHMGICFKSSKTLTLWLPLSWKDVILVCESCFVWYVFNCQEWRKCLEDGTAPHHDSLMTWE